jgi:hypothetical protein
MAGINAEEGKSDKYQGFFQFLRRQVRTGFSCKYRAIFDLRVALAKHRKSTGKAPKN